MLLYPNCKINIGLRVVRKREDGYHDLETVFYPVLGLHDELEVAAQGGQQGCLLETDGIKIDCESGDNLIVKCYRRMAARYPQIGAVSVRLKKNIPFGAGLGGGSSDAAHMAIALNELFDLQLTKEQLVQEVRPLGADCPFFIYNSPCFAEGIGDVLTPVDWSLKGFRLVMLKPDIAVSTREAYAGICPCANSLLFYDHGWLFGNCINDFEKTVFAAYPRLAQIKQHLLDAGAVYASMSGSGSTLFGLFHDNAESGAGTYLGRENEDFAAMVIFNDTLA